MKKFMVSVNGKEQVVPFVGKLFGSRNHPLLYSEEQHQYIGLTFRNFLTVGSRVADSGRYTHECLELYINGAKQPDIKTLRDEIREYTLIDVHNDWPWIVAENGLYIVKDLHPLMVLYNIKPELVFPESDIKKFSLPEFAGRGRLLTVLHPISLEMTPMMEADLEQEYYLEKTFGENGEGALYLKKDKGYLFWADCPDSPTAYLQDGIQTNIISPYIDVTVLEEPKAMDRDTVAHTWGIFFIDHMMKDNEAFKPIYLEANRLFGTEVLHNYAVMAQLRPPFKNGGEWYFSYTWNGFDRQKAIDELPAHVKAVME